ncbi:hypothetical protein IX324_002879 [Bacteroides pyogenes]|nr:hypothetical protein [Bacteroides pyogenes]
MFFFSQPIGVGRVYCRKICILQRIFLSFVHENPFFKIYFVQQFSIFHAELRTTIDNSSLQFKLDNGDSFMHLSNQAYCLFIVRCIGKTHFRSKYRTWIIGVSIHGECGQRKQVDTISVFKRRQIAVTHRNTNYIRNTTVIPRCGSHPKNIMISPLNVEIMIIAQSVHNNVRPRATVINVSYNMQRINRQPLNQVAHRNDKIIRPPG